MREYLDFEPSMVKGGWVARLKLGQNVHGSHGATIAEALQNLLAEIIYRYANKVLLSYITLEAAKKMAWEILNSYLFAHKTGGKSHENR